MNMEGIDPVMAHYMKLVMEGRKKEKDEEKEVSNIMIENYICGVKDDGQI